MRISTPGAIARFGSSYGPPNGPSRHAQHLGAFGLARPASKQLPQPGRRSAVQFRRSATHLAPLADLVSAVPQGASGSPTLAHFAGGYALGHGAL